MRRFSIILCSLLIASSAALAQDSGSTTGNPPEITGPTHVRTAKKTVDIGGPFTRLAFGGGIGVNGVNLQVATNLNRYLNVRGVGNVFKYDVNNISTNGFDVDAKLNLATAGASLDYYPFPYHGWRISPGLQFYNENGADAIFNVVGGTSFTLNDVTYYASSSNPVRGYGTFRLNKQKPAFTITTGWGNMIPRHGGHWSFPVEVGVALVGQPDINIALTQGQVCNAQGQNCVNVATDASVQSNLRSQIAKYRSDMEPLKAFPIVSFGMAYSFRIR